MPAITSARGRASAAFAEVASLRDRVAHEGRAIFDEWRPRITRRAYAPSALNLAHYLALRRQDIRPLQRRLMALGISSLGRLEAHVLVSLDAVCAALAALAGEDARCATPSERQFFRGEALLAGHAAGIFGPPHKGRAGRILVTLPTGGEGPAPSLDDLVARGADAIRINCAHDSVADWENAIARVRHAEAHAGRRIPVLMDIAGPKVRTVEVLTPPDRKRMQIGDLVYLGRKLMPALPDVPFQMTCTHPVVFDRAHIGDQVSFDDGALQGAIVGEAHNGFVIHIERGKLAGAKLRREKGLNFPTVDLGLDPLTDKDRADLPFVLANADLVGLSFVQSAADVVAFQAEAALHGTEATRISLVGKIETLRAVANLPEIIIAAAGRQPFAVMIARGDLAVEMGFERVAEMQEEILWLCEAAHVPVIWATQVLEGLVKEGLPSRGEMTDAAMAGRAECVMLNKGPNIAAAVSTLDGLLRRMAQHQVKKTPTLRALRAWAAPAAATNRA
jgi:pyruvate kinase